MNRNDPAFPGPAIDGESGAIDGGFACSGVTKRELAAMLAMVGINANRAFACECKETRAMRAVADADAILAEMEKPNAK